MKPFILTHTAKITEHIYVNGKHYVNAVTHKGKPLTILIAGKRNG